MTTAARTSADVGLIGLAVMGQNLALNMAEHGDPLCGLVGAAALPEFVAHRWTAAIVSGPTSSDATSSKPTAAASSARA